MIMATMKNSRKEGILRLYDDILSFDCYCCFDPCLFVTKKVGFDRDGTDGR